MSVLVWALIGILIGSFARKIMPGPAAGGFVAAIVIGIAGALIGGGFSVVFASGSWLQVAPQSVMLAVLGSLTFLMAYRANALRFAD
jgi:uncharacterized membrane protein YeaQ/YmgE (transglycosylase-associated protein family)